MIKDGVGYICEELEAVREQRNSVFDIIRYNILTKGMTREQAIVEHERITRTKLPEVMKDKIREVVR